MYSHEPGFAQMLRSLHGRAIRMGRPDVAAKAKAILDARFPRGPQQTYRGNERRQNYAKPAIHR